jgi:methyl-accepting chemotaxis protein
MGELDHSLNNFAGSFSEIMQRFSLVREHLSQASNVAIQGDPLIAVLVTIAKADHIRWVGKVLEAVTSGDTSLGADELKDETQCRLGRWMSIADKLFTQLPAYAQLQAIHSQLHQTGLRIVEAIRQGQVDKIFADAEQLKALSQTVQEQLDCLRDQVLRSGS